jgi:hypothetical protein
LSTITWTAFPVNLIEEADEFLMLMAPSMSSTATIIGRNMKGAEPLPFGR